MLKKIFIHLKSCRVEYERNKCDNSKGREIGYCSFCMETKLTFLRRDQKRRHRAAGALLLSLSRHLNSSR